MHSPFFLRHVCIFLLIAANLMLSIWTVRTAMRSFGPPHPLGLSMAGQAASLAYLTLSALAFLFALAMLLELEFSDDAAKCWRNGRNWASIQPGMTVAEVKKIMGEPKEERFETIFLYDLHPITILEYAAIHFENGRVSIKSPAQVEWLPPGVDIGLRDRFIAISIALSLSGIVLVALASLIPAGMTHGWASLPIYYPLIAGLCAFAYERAQVGGWRFDLFLLVPLYAIIGFTWTFRFYRLIRSGV